MDPMAFAIEHLRFWQVAALGLVSAVLAVPATLTGGQQPTVEELKARVANAGTASRPPLYIRISEAQLDAANRLYIAGDSEEAKTALVDVVACSELARDSAIQSRRHEKQSEIAIRKMVRKLADMKHTVSHEDQGQVQITIDRLQSVRDDLLAAMFPKGGKK
jgi:hypothetical protein